MGGKCYNFGGTSYGITITFSFILKKTRNIKREKAREKFHEGVIKEKAKHYYENKTKQT